MTKDAAHWHLYDGMLVVIAFIIAQIIDLNGVSLVTHVTDVIITSCFAKYIVEETFLLYLVLHAAQA